MLNIFTIFIFLFCNGLLANAKIIPAKSVKIAFLEFYDPDGNLVSLERGGRFGHVAISYKGGWIHSFPPRPVEWVHHLEPFGVVAEIIEVSHLPNYNEDFIAQELGKSSTLESEWEDRETTYCAKLVGQILGIPPRVNQWNATVWKDQPREIYALMGLSPDDIYEHVIANKNRQDVTYIPLHSCNSTLQ